MNKKDYIEEQKLSLLLKLSDLGLKYEDPTEFIKTYFNGELTEDDIDPEPLKEILNEFGDLFIYESNHNDNFVNIDISYMGSNLYNMSLGVGGHFTLTSLQAGISIILNNLMGRLLFLTDDVIDAVLNGSNDQVSHNVAKNTFINSFTSLKRNESLKGNVKLLIKRLGKEKTERILQICDCLSIDEIMSQTEDYAERMDLENFLLDE